MQKQSPNDSLSRALSASFAGHMPAIYKVSRVQENQLGGKVLSADWVLKRSLSECTDLYGRVLPEAKTFQRLESLFEPGIAIHVEGIYDSPRAATARRSIWLRYHAPHFEYSLAAQPGRSKRVNGGSAGRDEEVQPRVAISGDTSFVTVSLDPAIDGIPHSREEVYAWLTQPRACPYQLLYNRRAFAIRAPREDILEVLREYQQARADLKATKLDLAKFGSYRDFALEKFRLSSRTIPVAPPLVAGEAEFLRCRGGIIWTATGREKVPWCGRAVQLDVIGFYPSVMLTETRLPNCAPVPVMLPADAFASATVHPKFGLYRATVVVTGPGAKLWLSQSCAGESHYTSTDLGTARLLMGVPGGSGSITLANDGLPNGFQYLGAYVKAREAFEGYVRDLKPLKERGAPAGKRLLNMLWGALGQKVVTRVTIGEGLEAKDLPPGEMIGCQPQPDGSVVYEFAPGPGEPRFKGPFPRWGSFITAAGRQRMVKMILTAGVLDRVVRIHTDGFILSVPELKGCPASTIPPCLAGIYKHVGTEFGQLRLEHRGQVGFIGLRKPHWATPR